MLRLFFLPLLVLSISIACMGQTFQYSRGWTNGKRSSNAGAAEAAPSLMSYYRRDDERLSELSDTQECEFRLSKCLLQIQHLVAKQLQVRSAGDVGKFSGAGGFNRNNNHNNNNNRNSFGNHHQSNELLEDINSSGDSSDYLRH